MTRSRILPAASSALAIALTAAGVSSIEGGQTMSLASASNNTPAIVRRYGTTVKLGDAQARAYVTLDEKTGASLEIGVALDERALEGLPASGSGHHDGSTLTHTYLLDLPTEYTAPFNFVELNWNPAGHEPAGVYEGMPHFDFHFYTITKAERESIVPSDPQFAVKANNVPSAEYVPPFNVALGPPGAPPAAVAVPMMGVHWVDARSPELQALLGNPEGYKPFTSTFIHGSWDGRFTFWEPMITRAHILEKKATTDPSVRDQIIPLPIPARYQVPGYYPGAYRITWDAEAREYRIALTQLAWRN
jgi:hypothetical protein